MKSAYAGLRAEAAYPCEYGRASRLRLIGRICVDLWWDGTSRQWRHGDRTWKRHRGTQYRVVPA